MVKRLELYDNFEFLFLLADLELEDSMALLMVMKCTWNAPEMHRKLSSSSLFLLLLTLTWTQLLHVALGCIFLPSIQSLQH